MNKEVEFLVFDVEFLVKDPSVISAEVDEPLADYFYKDAVGEFLDRRTILTATDWSKSSNSKSFRPPTDEDQAILLKALNAAHAHLHRVTLPELTPKGETVVVVSELLMHIQFGCVSGRWKVIAAVVTSVATSIIAGCELHQTAKQPTWLERPNLSVDCSAQLATREQINHHMQVQLRYENKEIFNTKSPACVMLRQRVLKNDGHYSGKIDGVYGPKTVQAEIDAAKSLLIPSDDLRRLYLELSRA